MRKIVQLPFCSSFKHLIDQFYTSDLENRIR